MGGLSLEVSESRKLSSKEVWDSMFNREILLRHKSRCWCILEGDANSKFFSLFHEREI